MCPYAEFLFDGNYSCSLDDGSLCNEADEGCEIVSDLFEDEEENIYDEDD